MPFLKGRPAVNGHIKTDLLRKIGLPEGIQDVSCETIAVGSVGEESPALFPKYSMNLPSLPKRPIRFRTVFFLGLIELVVLLALYFSSYGPIKKLDMGDTPLYVDASGYVSFSKMILDGSFLSPEASVWSIDRVRRPPGFPVLIAIATTLTGGDPATGMAHVHFWAGLGTLVVLWFFIGRALPAGSTILALATAGFFSMQDPFRGAIPEWTMLLSIILIAVSLVCFFTKATSLNSFALVVLVTGLSLLKSAFTPFVLFVSLLVYSKRKLSIGRRLLAVFAGLAPLVLWCSVNFMVLRTPAPAVDLGFNLFGIVGLLPWPEFRSAEDETTKFREVLRERRAQAPENLFDFLDSRAIEVSVQDYNIWAVAKPTCDNFGFDYLRCERELRAVSFSVLAEHPSKYIEYVMSQLRLFKNRDILEIFGWFLCLSLTLLILGPRLFCCEPFSKTLLMLSGGGLLSAMLHSSVAQLYRRYMLCPHIPLVVFGVFTIICAIASSLRPRKES